MSRINRRSFIQGGLAVGAAIAATRCSAPISQAPSGTPNNPAQAPEINSNRIKDVVIRTVGTGAAQSNDIRDQAEKDLGFKINMRALSTAEVIQIGITQPKQYDIWDGEFFALPLVIPSGNLQALDVKKLKQFDAVTPIFTTGELAPGARVNSSQGTAPRKVMFLKDQNSIEFATSPTDWATIVPYQFGADTLGYRPDLVGRKIESWAELFNPEFRGKTSLLDIPSIGIMDAAMITEAQGLMTFEDKGNMTREEMDKVAKILIEQKQAGQFRAFWKSFDESVNFMSSGEVILQSMWSPAVAAVKSRGLPCVYAPLKEGYRGWGGGMGLSKNLSGIQLDAAYEYLNWVLDGWIGSFLIRQGFYSATPTTARKFMKSEEWDFWYDGKQAAIDIVDPYGKKIESIGAVRDGGGFNERVSNIVCWNSFMKEQVYLVYKWTEFVVA
ncbi:MAG: substrate-binding domain-containing protein [Drouetiella hepatica Uher 2000/2452]|jgi:putative spermidine/putrescine transport system substrate-binding protein|uniref:Substrate-binding domain-containing protein n=1 Tax=Drouetiella hepatica Uher 2000/2452 TaxID=904376 RepID=A0A951QFW6_9CYAN|nr:substrate-binding domain-containing protein [Drouetiella hepatica Uher 2000/2452]